MECERKTMRCKCREEDRRKRSISLLHAQTIVIHVYTYILHFVIKKNKTKKLVKTSTGVIIRQTSELYSIHTRRTGKAGIVVERRNEGPPTKPAFQTRV